MSDEIFLFWKIKLADLKEQNGEINEINPNK
jgi:hypothetical protein